MCCHLTHIERTASRKVPIVFSKQISEQMSSLKKCHLWGKKHKETVSARKKIVSALKNIVICSEEILSSALYNIVICSRSQFVNSQKIAEIFHTWCINSLHTREASDRNIINYLFLMCTAYSMAE